MSNTLIPITEQTVDHSFAPERVCYEAHWRNRSVFISAPCQSTREWQWHCLASAILLERLEDACVLAETILESSLQFFVSELPGECKNAGQANNSNGQETGYLRVLLTCSDDEVEVWMPAGAHTNMARHGELIKSSNLSWSRVSASIKIAHIMLDRPDVSRLQQGALILIPASWQQQWMCTVDVPQFECSIAATINPVSGTIDLDYNNSTEHTSVVTTDEMRVENASGQSLVTVYLDQPVTIDPGALLLGIQTDNVTSKSLSISVSLAQARCHCHINTSQFVADLIKVGDGFGLSIREFS